MAQCASQQKDDIIHFHIVDVNGNHFGWETHRNTFQITTNDTFNDFRNNIIKLLSLKYPIKHSGIIDCLKIVHKLKIFIDKPANDTQQAEVLFKKFCTNTSQYNLTDNVRNSIKNHVNKCIDLKNENICIWFIATKRNAKPLENIAQQTKINCTKPYANRSYNRITNTNTNNNNVHITKSKPNIKQIKTKIIRKRVKKRKIRDLNDCKNKKLRKKRKKVAIISNNVCTDSECIWLLCDIAPAMNVVIFGTTTKIDCTRSLLEQMLKYNWAKTQCNNNHIRLFAFSDILQDLTNETYIKYSETLALGLITKFDEYQDTNTKCHLKSEDCISYKYAIDYLLDVIINERKNGDFVLDRNRIILFTDGDRGKTHEFKNDIESRLIRKLKCCNVILDCIQIRNSFRGNKFLENLCKYDGIGKYWNPINPTLGNYHAIMKSEFMYNVKLRTSPPENNIIELD